MGNLILFEKKNQIFFKSVSQNIRNVENARVLLSQMVNEMAVKFEWKKSNKFIFAKNDCPLHWAFNKSATV